LQKVYTLFIACVLSFVFLIV